MRQSRRRPAKIFSLFTIVVLCGVAPSAIDQSARAASTPAWNPPPISSLIPSSLPLMGLSEVPEGYYDGPLTAEEFASLSVNPAAGKAEFEQWSAYPNFAGYIREWKDAAGLDTVRILLLQFPSIDLATAFTTEDEKTFIQVSRGEELIPPTLTLPGSPQSLGFTVTLLGAQEQGVVQGMLFRSNSYVCIVNTVAATPSGTTTAPLSPIATGTVSTLAGDELSLLSSIPPAPQSIPGEVLPTTTSPSSSGARPGSRSLPSSSLIGLVVAALVLLLVVGIVVRFTKHARAKRSSAYAAPDSQQQEATEPPRLEPATATTPAPALLASITASLGQRADGPALNSPVHEEAAGQDHAIQQDDASQDFTVHEANTSPEDLSNWEHAVPGAAVADIGARETAEAAPKADAVPEADAVPSAAGSPGSSTPPLGIAGWFPDPDDPQSRQRYWNGSAWTPHVAIKTTK